jgi:endonuclease YncB( thermonuclease family)
MSAASVIVSFVLLTVQTAGATAPDNVKSDEGAVISGPATVVDGDGLEIDGKKIRIHGIDAPEVWQYCSRTDGTRWRCGHYSTVALDRLVHRKTVSCRVRTRDQYDRAVAVCKVGTIDVGQRQVAEGWAVAYRRYSKAYVGDEDAAREAKRGVWMGRFEMPWDYRARMRKR